MPPLFTVVLTAVPPENTYSEPASFTVVKLTVPPEDTISAPPWSAVILTAVPKTDMTSALNSVTLVEVTPVETMIWLMPRRPLSLRRRESAHAPRRWPARPARECAAISRSPARR